MKDDNCAWQCDWCSKYKKNPDFTVLKSDQQKENIRKICSDYGENSHNCNNCRLGKDKNYDIEQIKDYNYDFRSCAISFMAIKEGEHFYSSEKKRRFDWNYENKQLIYYERNSHTPKGIINLDIVDGNPCIKKIGRYSLEIRDVTGRIFKLKDINNYDTQYDRDALMRLILKCYNNIESSKIDLSNRFNVYN